jgi:hypothetical protein
MKSRAAAASLEDMQHGTTDAHETQPELVAVPSLEEIRHRAYEIHFERGCIHGWDQDDWLRFGPGGLLCCVARDEVVGFDFASGECLGAIARLPRLNGQALVFFP